MKLDKNEVFDVYGKALKGDRKAQDVIVTLHRKAFPDHHLHMYDNLRSETNFKETLHMMYLHLYR